MPSMYVNVPKLPQETKDTLVAKLYEAAAPVLKAPHGGGRAVPYTNRRNGGLHQLLGGLGLSFFFSLVWVPSASTM